MVKEYEECGLKVFDIECSNGTIKTNRCVKFLVSYSQQNFYEIGKQILPYINIC